MERQGFNPDSRALPKDSVHLLSTLSKEFSSQFENHLKTIENFLDFPFPNKSEISKHVPFKQEKFPQKNQPCLTDSEQKVAPRLQGPLSSAVSLQKIETSNFSTSSIFLQTSLQDSRDTRAKSLAPIFSNRNDSAIDRVENSNLRKAIDLGRKQAESIREIIDLASNSHFSEDKESFLAKIVSKKEKIRSQKLRILELEAIITSLNYNLDKSSKASLSKSSSKVPKNLSRSEPSSVAGCQKCSGLKDSLTLIIRTNEQMAQKISSLEQQKSSLEICVKDLTKENSNLRKNLVEERNLRLTAENSISKSPNSWFLKQSKTLNQSSPHTNSENDLRRFIAKPKVFAFPIESNSSESQSSFKGTDLELKVRFDSKEEVESSRGLSRDSRRLDKKFSPPIIENFEEKLNSRLEKFKEKSNFTVESSRALNDFATSEDLMIENPSPQKQSLEILHEANFSSPWMNLESANSDGADDWSSVAEPKGEANHSSQFLSFRQFAVGEWESGSGDEIFKTSDSQVRASSKKPRILDR